MLSTLRPTVVVLAAMTLLTGVLYPAAVTAIASLVFPSQAEGSLLRRGDRVVGSALVGQPFDDPRYFWGRPSATGKHPYDAASSSGSNPGPASPAPAKAVAERVAALEAAGPLGAGKIPVDLVTASASGLDPHLSPAAARFQVPRVAAARGLSRAAVASLVEQHVEPRTLGLLGEPRVNVLLLNLALDELALAELARGAP